MSSSPQDLPPRISAFRKWLQRVLVALVIFTITMVFVLMTKEFIWGGRTSHELTTLDPKGSFAQSIQDLVNPVFLVAGIVFVGVIGGIGFIAWKFRDKGDDDDHFPVQLHGKTSFEIGWTLLPAVVLAAVGVFTVLTLIDLNKPAPQAIQVEVYGQQWWWGFSYDIDHDGSFTGPEDVTTATELIIPVGREVEVHVTSNDVIHSFWIPALNGKRDAVPGQTHPWKLEASEPGVYRGQCTEFCGLSHANMRMLVRAVPADEYDAWVANQQKPAVEPAKGSEAALGKDVFSAQLCSSCHLIDGVNNEKVESDKGVKAQLVSGVAPNLTHFATRGTFAGSIFNLYGPDPSTAEDPSGNAADVALPGNPGGALLGGDSAPYTFNQPAVEAWLRNPPAMKPAYATTPTVVDGVPLLRGMPNLGLSETQIDQLVAYLQTLK
jgi:cytochrome c oxidase subunit II